MGTHRLHSQTGEIFFVTFSCYKWLPLISITNSYSSVYKWFGILNEKGADILGYVIMPNHVHLLIYLRKGAPQLNKLISNGKRFLAYQIVHQLKVMQRHDILSKLSAGVQANERKKGKKHQVFRLSFDARVCFDEKMVEQKLDYIHANPVSGKWQLENDFADYEHSSAGFYEKGISTKCKIMHYKSVGSSL